MPGAHARCSASAAERFMECPGSVRLGELVPPEPDSDYALEGTAAHELAERCLRNNACAWEYAGETIEAGGKEFPVNAEMVGAVQTYVSYVRERAEGYELLVEHRIDGACDNPSFGGTSDAVINGIVKDGGFVHIFDYKHGAGVPVDIEDNSQLRYYAFGVLKSLGVTREDAISVGMTIVQPRAHHVQGPIRERWTDAADIIVWGEDELLPAIDKVDKEAEFHAGDHCRWCPARLLCPKVKGAFMECAEGNAKTADQLTDEALAEAYEKVRAAEHFIKAIKAEAFNRAMAGRPLAGTKLIYGRSSRNWKDGYEDAAVDKFGDDAFTDPSLKSPAQIDKLPGGKDFSSEWSFKEPGRPMLVDADAKGEPYKLDGSGFI